MQMLRFAGAGSQIGPYETTARHSCTTALTPSPKDSPKLDPVTPALTLAVTLTSTPAAPESQDRCLPSSGRAWRPGSLGSRS